MPVAHLAHVRGYPRRIQLRADFIGRVSRQQRAIKKLLLLRRLIARMQLHQFTRPLIARRPKQIAERISAVLEAMP